MKMLTDDTEMAEVTAQQVIGKTRGMLGDVWNHLNPSVSLETKMTPLRSPYPDTTEEPWILPEVKESPFIGIPADDYQPTVIEVDSSDEEGWEVFRKDCSLKKSSYIIGTNEDNNIEKDTETTSTNEPNVDTIHSHVGHVYKECSKTKVDNTTKYIIGNEDIIKQIKSIVNYTENTTNTYEDFKKVAELIGNTGKETKVTETIGNISKGTNVVKESSKRGKVIKQTTKTKTNNNKECFKDTTTSCSTYANSSTDNIRVPIQSDKSILQCMDQLTCSTSVNTIDFIASPKTVSENVNRSNCTSSSNKTEHSIERPVERLVERPIERLVERPIERLVERPIEGPIERPVERFVETPIERFVEHSICTSSKDSIVSCKRRKSRIPNPTSPTKQRELTQIELLQRGMGKVKELKKRQHRKCSTEIKNKKKGKDSNDTKLVEDKGNNNNDNNIKKNELPDILKKKFIRKENNQEGVEFIIPKKKTVLHSTNVYDLYEPYYQPHHTNESNNYMIQRLNKL